MVLLTRPILPSVAPLDTRGKAKWTTLAAVHFVLGIEFGGSVLGKCLIRPIENQPNRGERRYDRSRERKKVG